MSLKITLKPHEKIIIDSAVITNGNSTSDLIIENNVPVLRQNFIMSESDADSHCRRIYFVIQLMYIDGENLETHHNHYWKLVRDLVDVAPSVLGLIDMISKHILSSEYYKALKLARQLMEYEEEAINRVPERTQCLSNS